MGVVSKSQRPLLFLHPRKHRHLLSLLAVADGFDYYTQNLAV